jgi:hypothetical protein
LESNRASTVIRIVVWTLAGLVVLVTLALAVTAATLPGCRFCHNAPAFVSQTAKGAHSRVDCVRCHVQPDPASRFAYAYHLVFGMTLGVAPTNSGPIAGIPNSTCLSCHGAVMKRVVSANELTIKHALCSKGRLCTDCHSQVAHGAAVKWPTSYTMNQCLDCHNTAKVRADCKMCHSAEFGQTRFRGSGTYQVTHGPDWKQTHGMGPLQTCVSCHPNDYCVKCHEIPLPHDANIIRTHPTAALEHRKACAVCHRQTFCDRCHGLPMPHPTAFTPQHPSIVKEKGTAFCLRCHVIEDCNLCHAKHVHPGGASIPPGMKLQ